MTEEDQELIEDLRETKKRFGVLYPILLDPDGNVIDGKHRLEADANWPKVTVDWLRDPVSAKMLRLVGNTVRREVSAEEKTQLLGELAEETGLKPKELAQALGRSHKWVLKYIADKYKRSEGYEEPRIPRRGIQEEKPIVSQHETDILLDDVFGKPVDYVLQKLEDRGLSSEDAEKTLADYREKHAVLWKRLYGDEEPNLEKEANKLPMPQTPKTVTATCPLCGNRVLTETLDLVYQDFKYGQPKLTVLELMQKAEK